MRQDIGDEIQQATKYDGQISLKVTGQLSFRLAVFLIDWLQMYREASLRQVRLVNKWMNAIEDKTGTEQIYV